MLIAQTSNLHHLLRSRRYGTLSIGTCCVDPRARVIYLGKRSNSFCETAPFGTSHGQETLSCLRASRSRSRPHPICSFGPGKVLTGPLFGNSQSKSALSIFSMPFFLIYFSYFLRALRWKIFLRPVRRVIWAVALIRSNSNWIHRPGAAGASGRIDSSLPHRSSNQSYFFLAVSSLGGRTHISILVEFTVLLVLAIFFPRTAPSSMESGHRSTPSRGRIFARRCGRGFWRWQLSWWRNLGEGVLAAWIEVRFSHLAANFGHRIAQRVREFHGGLDTVHGPFAFLQIVPVCRF